jgi:hypothetical protein
MTLRAASWAEAIQADGGVEQLQSLMLAQVLGGADGNIAGAQALQPEPDNQAYSGQQEK